MPRQLGIGEFFTFAALGIIVAYCTLARFYASCVVLVGLVALAGYVKWCYGFFSRMGLSGPKPIAPLGNMWDLFKGGGVHANAMRYGPIYGKMYGTFMGLTPVFNTWDVEISKQIMIKDFASFQDRITPIAEHDTSKEKNAPLLDNMLLFIGGQQWKDVRNTVTPTFTTGKLKHMVPHINQSSKTLIEVLINECSSGCSTLDVKKYMTGFTLDVISSVALGVKIDSIHNPEDPIVLNSIAINNVSFTNPFLMFFFMFPWLSRKLRTWLGFQSFRLQGEAFFKELLQQVVEQRKQKPKVHDPDFLQLLINAAHTVNQNEVADTSESYHENRKSFRTPVQLNIEELLLKNVQIYFTLEMTDELIKSQAFLFLIAGFDTTALTLQYICYCLALNQNVQEKCHEEIVRVTGHNQEVTYEAVQHLSYVESVIYETLRLYPPLPNNARVATEDYKINDHVIIPKGCTVNSLAYLIHHSPEYYDKPEEFQPERFSPELRNERHPCAFQPFGLGPRNCIGMRFAMLEIKVVLCYLLKHFRISKSEKTEVPLMLHSSNFLRTVNPMYLTFESRH